jgi:predicted regulator of Ras-like GTPase activity (Roadblock/LC7/MglB family)
VPLPQNDVLSRRLRTILQTSFGLEALALVGMNGDEIASILPQGASAGRVASMALAAFSLSEQIAVELQRQTLDQLYIRGKYGFIVIIPLENQYLLFALARETAKPGLVFLELQRAASQLLAD